MSDDASNDPKPFDLYTLKFLAALMSRHDLSEIDLSEGDARIRMRRGSRLVAPTASSVPLVAHTPQPAAAPAPPVAAAPEKPKKNLVDIKSTMVGTFYNREKPESPPYVAAGAKVGPRTIVGLLEAMKLFNEVYAECTGVVVEVLVDNQQFVEYGQVLFRVDPTS